MLELDLHNLHSFSSQPAYENDGHVKPSFAHSGTHCAGVGSTGCRLNAANVLLVGIVMIAPMIKICFLNFVLLLISK